MINKDKGPSLVLCIARAFYGKFVAAALFKFLNDMIAFFGPVILE